MTLDEVLTSLFPAGHSVERGEFHTLHGTGRLTSGGDVALVGVADGLPLGIDGTILLAATYYDTFDLRLAKDKVTLRRRTGGKDAGWHLKLPGDGDGRREISAPLGRARAVPAELLELVQALVRTETLHPVATLKTRAKTMTGAASCTPSAKDLPAVCTASWAESPMGRALDGANTS